MRRSIAGALLALSLAACGNRSQPPERTTTGTRLNVGATALTPEVHINPQDAGALQLQVGAARVQLPGEGDNRAAAAEREAAEGR